MKTDSGDRYILQKFVSDNEILLRYDTRSGLWIIRNPIDGHYLGANQNFRQAFADAMKAMETYEDVKT